MKSLNVRARLNALHDTSGAFERTVIDLISAITPWLAPAIPASMTYNSMIGKLGFSEPIALIGAAAVEFLGLASINTAIEFWRYNEDKRYRQMIRKSTQSRKSVQKKPKFKGAPLFMALFTGFFYITIVLTVNALLDTSDPIHVFAKALLSLLSVVAGIIIALRASHSRLTTNLKAKSVSQPESHDGTIKTKRDYFEICASRNGQGPVLPDELMKVHGITRPTAYRWHKEWVDSHKEAA